MQLILQNLGTIIVCFVLAAVVALIVLVMRRDKKMGKSSCGNSCGACPMRDSCHAPKNESGE